MESEESLSNLCYGDFERSFARDALSRSLYSVTAVDGYRIVGMARLTGDGVYDLIVDVVVMPQYQGKGIGSSR